jgi:PilZ domain
MVVPVRTIVQEGLVSPERRTLEAPQFPKLFDTPAKERRKEIRYSTNDPAVVSILPLNGDRMPAAVIDISKSGLRLELGKAIRKGGRIEVKIMPSNLVIFGEVRYCRRSGAVYHAGVLIEGMVSGKADQRDHLQDDQISLYAVGKGLSVPEILQIKDHLQNCDACSKRLANALTALRSKR